MVLISIRLRLNGKEIVLFLVEVSLKRIFRRAPTCECEALLVLWSYPDWLIAFYSDTQEKESVELQAMDAVVFWMQLHQQGAMLKQDSSLGVWA